MPPILSGILAIYGLVVSVIISTALKEKSALHTNFLQLAAGISVGLSCLAAGFCIGIVGDAGVRGVAQQPRLFVGMMLMLIFAEVLGGSLFSNYILVCSVHDEYLLIRVTFTGIYGLIVALLLVTQSLQEVTKCL